MKRIVSLALLLLAFFGSAQISRAQDVIVKKDASTILAKILSISETEIEYKKWDNQDGPTFKINLSSVMSVTYQNGTTDAFNKPASQQATSSQSVSPKPSRSVEKIYADGDELHDAYTHRELSAADLKQILSKQEYNNYLQAMKEYPSPGFWVFSGVSTGVGVPLLVYGIKSAYEEGYGHHSAGTIISAVAGLVLSGFGIFGLGGCVSGRIKSKALLNSVVSDYNARSTQSTQTSLSLDATPNGFGLVYRF